MQQKPAITHCSGSLPMKATKLKVMMKMAMEMSLHHNMMLRGVCCWLIHVLHFNICTTLTTLSWLL